MIPPEPNGRAATTGSPAPGSRSIARWALLLALPLILLGLAASQLLEADYVVTRDRARVEAEHNADRLGAAAGDAVGKLAQTLRDRLATTERTDDEILAARSLLYSNEASAVLVRLDGRRLFPPDGGWDLTAGMAAHVKALEAAADLQPGSKTSAGWYAGTLGPVFFQCGLDGAGRQVCVALDWPHVDTAMLGALDTAAGSRSGWSFRLRDPFDRFVWAQGAPQFAAGDAFDLSGTMRGWRMVAIGPSAGGQGLWGRLALALPIAVAWLVLVWSKVRQQRDRIAESAARADLVAKLSHDLRTPLANVKLYAELIARQAAAGATGRDKIPDYCRVITEEIDRLDGLAGNTIAYGAVARPVRLDDAAPDEVVRTIVARLGKLLETSGCRCEVDGGADRPCRFDRTGFERILVNLLDNARKYAPGEIRVTTALDAEKLRLSVRDWGVGFSMLRPVEGFGLGLAVVRDLATANGGRVDVVPCVPGTRVDVTMRVAPAVTE